MRRLWHRVLCYFGWHVGVCREGGFHCLYCPFSEPYPPSYDEVSQRRMAGKTTDPGGVDGPPYDRPLADNVIEVDPEAGARQGGDPVDPYSGHDLPL